MFVNVSLRRSGGRPDVALAVTVLATALAAAGPSSVAHAATPRVHAITGARLVLAPGRTIERGTLVMRDGVITAAGARVEVPADARVWDGEGLTVYAGLIDAFVVPAAPPARGPGARAAPGRRAVSEAPSPARGPAHPVPGVRPETRIAEALPLGREQLESLRAAGFAAAQVVPGGGVLRGTSAVIGLGEGTPNARVLDGDAAQVVAVLPDTARYPGSLMGAIAVIRQAFLDARWYRDAWSTYNKSPSGKERPEVNLAWEALGPVISGARPALFVADDMLEVLRSAAIAREAGVMARVVGAGDEYKRVKEIAKTGLSLVVPVDFPEAPDVSDPELAVEVSTVELRHWNRAPENPAILKREGVTFALTAGGLDEPKRFRAQVAKAIERGLDPEAALAAVTTVPAGMLGLSGRLGTLEPGKIANLTVTRGDLFANGTEVREVWVDGERYEVESRERLRGEWMVAWNSARHAMIVTVGPDTTVKLVVGADTLRGTGVRIERSSVRFTVRRGEEEPEYFFLEVDGDRLTGTLSVGEWSHMVSGTRAPGTDRDRDRQARARTEPVPAPRVMGDPEAWRAQAPPRPAAVLVRNATLWTAGPQGVLERADLLVRNGRIAAVGRGINAPAGAVVIDGTGKHVAPGIIDAHSHAAILGGVNECTHAVTAEVRIGDVVNSESINIYRQLAGGTTMMHLLHGSCNAIGGQSAVIKNRWGESAEGLLFEAAPPTIKFALGENPKQSNFGNRSGPPRYPQSRGGVQEVIRTAFAEARDHRTALDEWRRGKRHLPPRRDLQKEAVLEILEGKRHVHSHSYRQDEILMLMRAAEEFGFKIQCFQHILEGYKVADEMAAHGATASSFSDWWAYKFEVIDAIPYSGYLMWDRGVTVSFNSDSDELARRLNTEAAKAIKYGGVPREQAIQFVTLNAARQLRVEGRVGSLEVGKDADFSIWNGSPLSPYSLCEQTWIEGRKYFDRAADLSGREALAKEREALIERARAAPRDRGGPMASRWPPRYLDGASLEGNDCGVGIGAGEEFMGEALRRALRNQEVRR